jgi:hypothetical protein
LDLDWTEENRTLSYLESTFRRILKNKISSLIHLVAIAARQIGKVTWCVLRDEDSGILPCSRVGDQSERASDLLELVHTNVCESMSSVGRGGFQYFITFIDDFSKYGYIYLMRHKFESFEKFKKFHNEVQNQLDKTIKFL